MSEDREIACCIFSQSHANLNYAVALSMKDPNYVVAYSVPRIVMAAGKTLQDYVFITHGPTFEHEWEQVTQNDPHIVDDAKLIPCESPMHCLCLNNYEEITINDLREEGLTANHEDLKSYVVMRKIGDMFRL